jgi:hypothetical protein
MTLPRWNCFRAAQRAEFEAWTNAQLDAEELAAYDPTTDPMLDNDFVDAYERDINADYKRGRVLVAKHNKDWETVAQLADTQELRRIAYRPRPRGRVKGEPRPRDVSQSVQEAASYYRRIRALWLRHYGRHNRSMAPTAIDIAARRWRVEPEQLANYLKNH